MAKSEKTQAKTPESGDHEPPPTPAMARATGAEAADPVPKIEFGGTTYTLPYAALLPAHDDIEIAEMKADIRKAGRVECPVLVTPGNAVIDGATRLRLAAELKLDPSAVTITVRGDLDPAQAGERAWALNLLRWHLTTEQKRELIAGELKRHPGYSDQFIGRRCAVSHNTVKAVRAGLVATGQIDRFDTRVGRDKKERPATQKGRPAAAATIGSAGSPAGTGAQGVSTEAAAAAGDGSEGTRPDTGGGVPAAPPGEAGRGTAAGDADWAALEGVRSRLNGIADGFNQLVGFGLSSDPPRYPTPAELREAAVNMEDLPSTLRTIAERIEPKNYPVDLASKSGGGMLGSESVDR